MSENHWIVAGKEEDLVGNKPKVVELDGVRIALFKVSGENAGVFAIEDVCTHDDGPLAEGFVDGEVIECPRHGAKFNIKTGAVVRMPAVAPVRTFEVRVQKGLIEVRV